MAKKTVTNISQALSCVRKLKSGKACTMQELKSSLLLLETAYRTVQRGKKEFRRQTEFLERQLDRFSSFRN
tara:strand:- start:724 stop:936 length:213 start_codon:yes stop_codon:yes gene_type:complete